MRLKIETISRGIWKSTHKLHIQTLQILCTKAIFSSSSNNLTVRRSSILVTTPIAISLLSDWVSGHGYTVPWNLPRHAFTYLLTQWRQHNSRYCHLVTNWTPWFLRLQVHISNGIFISSAVLRVHGCDHLVCDFRSQILIILQGPSFSRTFKGWNLQLLNSSTFKDFERPRGTLTNMLHV